MTETKNDVIVESVNGKDAIRESIQSENAVVGSEQQGIEIEDNLNEKHTTEVERVDQTEVLNDNNASNSFKSKLYVHDRDTDILNLDEVGKYKFDLLTELNESSFDLRVATKAVEQLRVLRKDINSTEKYREVLIRYGVFLGEWYKAVIGGQWCEEGIYYTINLGSDFNGQVWPFQMIAQFILSTETDEFPLLEYMTHTWVEYKVAGDCWEAYAPQIPR